MSDIIESIMMAKESLDSHVPNEPTYIVSDEIFYMLYMKKIEYSVHYRMTNYTDVVIPESFYYYGMKHIRTSVMS